MPTHTRLAIVGAGIVGSSAAYHLTRLGWRDILVLDKGGLEENDGSTSHAPGGVVALSHSKLLTQMAVYSSDLYRSLTPFDPARNTYNAVGGLEIAISERRLTDLKRLHAEGKSFGAESFLLSPKETKDKLPPLDETQIVGSLFVPKSAIIAGAHTASALQRDAAAGGGARFIPATEVTDIEVKAGRVVAVITSNPELPRIECEAVLLCTNIWGPVLGDKLGVPIPLLAYEHQYTITAPLPGLAQFDRNRRDDEINWPTARELDSAIYFRRHWDSYGIGNYWHRPRPVNPQAVGRSALRAFTPEDFEKCWAQVQRLLPIVRGAALTTRFNGMFAFPVDGMPIMGESHVRGLWTAVGSWITHAGGVGKAIAEWMTHGEAEWDMRLTNLHRFQPYQTTRKFIALMCDKNYAELYDVVHPRLPLSRPRNLRLTPFHPRWGALGAEFTTFAGLELPNWCAENARLLEKYDDRIPHRTGWAAENWSRIQGAEHLATREAAALYDLTGLSIFEARGPGALPFVNHLCSNQMDVPVGRITYTTWLTPKGGVRRDLAVLRLEADRFWMFVGEGTRPQDWVWVNRAPIPGRSPEAGEGSHGEASHSPFPFRAGGRGDGLLADLSDGYAALGLWGPKARAILSAVTDADVSNDAFPYMTARWIDIGYTRVLALRVSYVGELGWELHMPMDAALDVWDTLWEAGRAHGLIGAGMGAFDSLRLEKGYRLWGGDVYTEHTPYESGLGWTVKLSKGDFVGREACMSLKDQPLRKKLCALTLDDPNAAIMGAEPIMADGQAVGFVTSANFGYSVGKFIVYGYLPPEHSALGTKLHIEYFGERLAATVAADPQWDVRMERLKA
jgi:glycine cleavage system aminomethyltransferase T/glycine/D-amino acid oxidase-like deaminating enzyme